MTGRIERLPEEGERCVVAGWPIERDGRKLHAGTALYGEDGEVLALSRQLWIEPADVVTGAPSGFTDGCRGVSATSRPPSSS